MNKNVSDNININYTCDSNEACGILMEKIICDISNIKFNSKRKYIDKIPIDIFNDIKDLNIIQNLNISKHCGNENKYYDFLDKDNKTISLKTNISNNKICPAYIGQVSLKQFNIKCKEFCIIKNKIEYKKLVLSNSIDVINMYLKNLFLCDIILYINFIDNKIYLIKNKIPLLSKDTIYKFSKDINTWKESTTFYIKFNNKWLSFAEFQVHNNRDVLKCRININSLIKYNLDIDIDLDIQVINLKLNYIIKTKMPIEVNVFQTFNYIGSKTKLLNYIGECITEYTKKDIKDIKSFLDPFSGTGVVSYYMLKNGCKNVTSNDIQHYAYTISSVWSDIDINISKIKEILSDINNILDDIDDIDKNKINNNYIYNTYTPASNPPRMYFTELNGYKIDIARNYIEKISKDISYNEYKLLIKILLYSASNVANISSTYGAFLKKFKINALKELVLKDNILETLVKSESDTKHKTYNKDIFELIKEIETKDIEVCYLDSPYNSRNYSKNYFVLEGISKYDLSSVRGITGIRDEEIEGSKSFCSKVNTKKEFEKLFEQIKCKYLFMSYSSDSIVSKTDIISLLSKNWTNIICKEQDYKKFKSNNNTDNKQIVEYLFCTTLK